MREILEKRWLPALPALLLVIVASTQIIWSRTLGLTPWKGGGFGMFSSLDDAAFRFVRVVVEAPDRSEEIEMAPSLEDAAARAVTLPSAYRLERLAVAVAARERRNRRPVTVVRVEVWRQDFDRVTLRATERRMRTLTYRAAP
jgi:hypothetical protein